MTRDVYKLFFCLSSRLDVSMTISLIFLLHLDELSSSHILGSHPTECIYACSYVIPTHTLIEIARIQCKDGIALMHVEYNIDSGDMVTNIFTTGDNHAKEN